MSEDELKAIEADVADSSAAAEAYAKTRLLVAEVRRLRSENGAHVKYIADADDEIVRLRGELAGGTVPCRNCGRPCSPLPYCARCCE